MAAARSTLFYRAAPWRRRASRRHSVVTESWVQRPLFQAQIQTSPYTVTLGCRRRAETRRRGAARRGDTERRRAQARTWRACSCDLPAVAARHARRREGLLLQDQSGRVAQPLHVEAGLSAQHSPPWRAVALPPPELHVAPLVSVSVPVAELWKSGGGCRVAVGKEGQADGCGARQPSSFSQQEHMQCTLFHQPWCKRLLNDFPRWKSSCGKREELVYHSPKPIQPRDLPVERALAKSLVPASSK